MDAYGSVVVMAVETEEVDPDGGTCLYRGLVSRFSRIIEPGWDNGAVVCLTCTGITTCDHLEAPIVKHLLRIVRQHYWFLNVFASIIPRIIYVLARMPSFESCYDVLYDTDINLSIIQYLYPRDIMTMAGCNILFYWMMTRDEIWEPIVGKSIRQTNSMPCYHFYLLKEFGERWGKFLRYWLLEKSNDILYIASNNCYRCTINDMQEDTVVPTFYTFTNPAVTQKPFECQHTRIPFTQTSMRETLYRTVIKHTNKFYYASVVVDEDLEQILMVMWTPEFKSNIYSAVCFESVYDTIKFMRKYWAV